MKFRRNPFLPGLLVSLALASAVNATEASFRYFRFTPIKLRGDSTSNSIQLAEFTFLLAGSPVSYTGASVSNPGGYTPTAEVPANLLDGNTATKWLDFSKSPLVFDFGASTTIDGYRFTTAADATERDPLRWTLEGSADGSSWTLLDHMTSDFATPTARTTATSNIALSATPVPCVKNWTGSATLNWNSSELNWTNGGAVSWDNNSLDVARFSGTSATISLTEPVILRALDFTQAGYAVQGGSLLLTGVSRLTANAPAAISSSIGGSVGIVKNGSSTLTLSGANTFSGGNGQTGPVLVRDGTLVLTGSNAYTGRTMVIGGTLTFSGSGSKTGTGDAIIGNATGKGVLNIGGSSNVSFNGTPIAGNEANGVGAIRMTGGTASFSQDSQYLTLGNGTNSYGTLELSGGTLTIPTFGGIRTGFSGIGVLTQSGGTLNCGRWFAIAGGNARGVATFSGGAATINGSYRILLGDGATSIATLNVGTLAGGSATVTSSNGTGVTVLGSNTASAAVLNLNSGALVLGGPIYRNTANTTGSAALNLNGGTLRASGSVNLITASATLPVYLFKNGVTVDSQGNSASIPANLLVAAGNGIYPAGGVFAVPSGGGSGYYGAPAVTVSGGSGTGATAIANVTDGVVTGVTLTSPGQGYLAGDVVTFTFTGGGATTAATPFGYTLSAGDVAANGGGGLTKTGAGTLTLGGANTYGGATSIKNGTLVLQGTNATSSVVLGDTATAGKLQLGNTTAASNLSLTSISTNAGGGSVVGGNATANSVLTLGVASGTQSITALGGFGTNENALSLVKNGAGTLAVTGSTSLTGSTTVNAGTLQVPTGSSLTGPCTIADGAALSITGGTSNSWATTDLALGSTTGATINILNFNVAATAAPIAAFNSLVPSGTVTVNVNGIFSPGVYPLISYPSGGSIGGAGISAFQLGPVPRGVVANLIDDEGFDAVSLNVSAVDALTWKGNVNGDWDVNGTANWTLGASADKFLDGDNIRFDDSATTNTTITLNSIVTTSNVVFDHTLKNYTVVGSGGITGITQLTKLGDGSLTLACANSYTGTTLVSAGTLSLGDGTSNGSVAGTLINNANLIFNPATSATLPGTLDGTGTSLIKTGSGTQILTGNNTYYGVIQINAGMLQIGSGATNGSFGFATSYDVADGATLRLNYATAVSATTGGWSNRITGSGILSLNSAQPVNGSAAWGIFSMSPSFTGVVHVQNGRVDCADSSSLGGTAKVQLLNGSQLLTRNSVAPYTPQVEISGLGWGESGYNQGALRIAGGHTATWAGNVTLTADSGIMCQSGGNFTIAGSISGPYVCQFHSQSGATLTLAPTAVTRNSYGTTRINGATDGVVVAGNTHALSAGPLEVTSSTLKLNGNSFSFASLAGTGGRIGNYHASEPSVLAVGGSSDTIFSGAVVDGGFAPLALVKTGAGTLTLTGANTYTGNTSINAGVLAISSAFLADGSTVSIASGAQIALNTGTAEDTVAELILGGVTVPPGTYNSTHGTYGSYFAGTGSIVIVGGYDSWATDAGLTGANNGLTDDADNDGTDNLLEFYLNGNPLASDPSILPVRSLDATYLTLTFSRRDDAEADVTSQFLQYGSDLAGWTNVPIGATTAAPDGNGVIVTVAENADNPDTITVQIPRALAPTGKLFGRLQVTK